MGTKLDRDDSLAHCASRDVSAVAHSIIGPFVSAFGIAAVGCRLEVKIPAGVSGLAVITGRN